MMNIPFWQANSESPATPPGDMSRVVEDGEVEVKAADTLWSTEGTVDLGGITSRKGGITQAAKEGSGEDAALGRRNQWMTVALAQVYFCLHSGVLDSTHNTAQNGKKTTSAYTE